jgi:hypothetical protein
MTPRQHTTRRRKRPAGPNVPEFHPGQLLDWRSWKHWGGVDLPCRYCGKPTPLLDSKGASAHKVCAEDALAKQYAQAVAEYQEGAL